MAVTARYLLAVAVAGVVDSTAASQEIAMRPRRRRTVLAVLPILALAACTPPDDADGGVTPAPTVTVTVPVTKPSPEATDDGGAAAGPCADLGPGSTITDLAVLFVTAPTVGAEVSSGFAVAGCTNAFEATFQWELVDRDGAVLAGGNGTATCGSGCLGTFEFTVDYTVERPILGTLKVFTLSAEDASADPQDLNALPLRLQP
ncbi:MAG TPA: Gmad2 immunoglobulin-like domain-containing protein [Nitriliruptorales bacterium]|nr:Gmad2 immunoglobulin-like domain-containing protein [Nitriliruptorales bacterium]